MDDKEILSRIDELVATEHELRGKLAAGEMTTTEEHARLKSTEEALDQAWDLLRQRRARREFGTDESVTGNRPVTEVENYQQ
jgi:hypothetical protein